MTWASYVQQVSPLGGVAVPPPPVPETAPAAAPDPLARTRSETRVRRTAPLEVGAAPGGLDRATWTRFRTGRLRAERTLDLHGRTAQRAHSDLHGFVARALADGLRCVEVITGRGSGETGVIRRELPLWLNASSLRPHILAASHPHPANPGSVRLLLRRARELNSPTK